MCKIAYRAVSVDTRSCSTLININPTPLASVTSHTWTCVPIDYILQYETIISDQQLLAAYTYRTCSSIEARVGGTLSLTEFTKIPSRTGTCKAVHTVLYNSKWLFIAQSICWHTYSTGSSIETRVRRALIIVDCANVSSPAGIARTVVPID